MKSLMILALVFASNMAISKTRNFECTCKSADECFVLPDLVKAQLTDDGRLRIWNKLDQSLLLDSQKVTDYKDLSFPLGDDVYTNDMTYLAHAEFAVLEQHLGFNKNRNAPIIKNVLVMKKLMNNAPHIHGYIKLRALYLGGEVFSDSLSCKKI